MSGTTYTPGSATALVGPAGALLLLGDPAPERVARLWPVVRDGGDLHVLLEALAAEGLREMGPFALRHGTSVVVRGAGSAQVGPSGTRFDGRGVTTWTEHAVDADAPVQLLADPEGTIGPNSQLPLVCGVVRAASVDVGAVQPRLGTPSTPLPPAAPTTLAVPLALSSSPDPESGPLHEPDPAGEPVSVVPVPEPTTTVHPLPLDDLPVQAVPLAAVPVEAVPLAAVPLTAVPLDPVQPEWTLAPDVAIEQAEPAPARPTPPLVDEVPAADDGYDHLFGDTVHRSVEDAAVRPVEAAADAPPAEPVSQPDTDHDGSTVLRSELRRARPAAPAPTSTDDGPPVLGLRCVRGHANPPHPGTCRWCGAVVADGEPQLLGRPALGRLRVSDGASVALDRSVLIGRAPSSTRFSADGPPHLVRVASPQQDVSRTHLEVRVEDWDVLAVDHSANGTRLTRSGADPLVLHRGEPVLVQPGCVLDLGDGVTVVYEVDGP